MYKIKLSVTGIFIFLAGCSVTQQTGSYRIETAAIYKGILLDTVKAQEFDTGKMWTFDFPPLDYFAENYNFHPSDEWLTDVRMASLKFANWCSASFISEDGLILTNYHCSDFRIPKVEKEDESVRKNGFIAEALDDERRDEGVFVDQLVFIEDVTEEVHAAIAAGKTDEEKRENKSKIIRQLKNKYPDTDLNYNVVSLYQGGRYSLYGYKRYTDVRLVLMPESEVGLFGGDYDNYTYPRYCLDFTLWRAYDEDGNPLKINNYFKWSKNGAQPNEPLFVVGNPGNTSKLKTFSQLEFMRDYSTRSSAFIATELQNIYTELIDEYPERYDELIDRLSGAANGAKRYQGILSGLSNPYYMARKKDFENNLRDAVESNSQLKRQYGNVWDNIASTRNEMRKIADEYYTMLRTPPMTSEYFNIAYKIVNLANELQIPEDERSDAYKSDNLSSTIDKVFPLKFDKPLNDKKLRIHVGLLRTFLGEEHPLVKSLIGGRKRDEAVNYLLANSKLNSSEYVKGLIEAGPKAILSSDDPFISFVVKTQDRYEEIQKLAKEINATEANFEELLGHAIYAVYGTSIPPDGSFTLRISDGVLQSYDYNGTIAPEITTFYGMYDRYYSFNKKYPWSLPTRWQTPPQEFDLETPFNFISTHDIVGGSSGSPVINKNKEIIGLAFDGNIESNSGYFIFDTTENRMISVASQGILETIKDLYKAKRIAEEIINGKIVH
jgi:hypothetical protein